MEKIDMFVPREQSSKLKQLGFNEMVVAKYQKLSEGANYQLQLLGKERNCNALDTAISAPTWCQVFDWFRVNYGHYSNIVPNPTSYIKHQNKDWLFGYNIINNANPMFDLRHKTYEEARLKCLEKLIELCTKK